MTHDPLCEWSTPCIHGENQQHSRDTENPAVPEATYCWICGADCTCDLITKVREDMLAKCIAAVGRIQNNWFRLPEYEDAAKRIANSLRALQQPSGPIEDLTDEEGRRLLPRPTGEAMKHDPLRTPVLHTGYTRDVFCNCDLIRMVREDMLAKCIRIVSEAQDTAESGEGVIVTVTLGAGRGSVYANRDAILAALRALEEKP